MSKITKLNDITDPKEFVSAIKDKELLIYEDIQGSKIYVNWDGEKITIKPKSLKNVPLNFIDVTLQKYYNNACVFFFGLPAMVTDLLNKDWWFCFEYFPDNQPAHIEYNRLPKNNLILSCIVKNNVYKYDFDEIVEYAKLFDVDHLPVIYKGKLSDKQLEIMELFLRTSDNDLEYVYGEDNFASFFYKILNPNLTNSFLMEDGKYHENLEKLIIKVDRDETYSFELLNPLHKKMVKHNYSDFVDNYSLILISFLQYVQLNNYQIYKLTSLTKDELYIELICYLFNDYIKQTEKDISKWELNIPSFFKEDKFKINTQLLLNKETIKWIKSNPKIEYVFKCILGSFNKIKKKPIGIFTEQTLLLFNNWVNNLHIWLERKLNINRDYAFQRSDVKNFKDFWDLKYSSDGDGEIYPDIYDEFATENGEDKKKKKTSIKKEVLDEIPETPIEKEQLK